MIVIKIGGSIYSEVSSSFLEELKEITSKKPLILVHGGGDKVTEIADRLGKKQEFIVSPEGIRSRYTDKETSEIYTMVMAGKINKEIVSSLIKKEIKAIGLSGIDAELLRAERKKKLIIVDERGRKRIIDGGYTGKIVKVNVELLNLLLSNNFIPVVSPVAISEEHEFLNVDGDRAAAYIAGSLKAETLIFLTDVDGVLIDGKVISRMNYEEAEELMPKIGFGMKTKVLASLEALKMGCNRAIICNGKKENILKLALEEKEGSLIYKPPFS
ncbi:MAG: [LysW]-aminoadipate/[LysW]-glutamate kinase [Nitrososphaerales archaeon]